MNVIENFKNRMQAKYVMTESQINDLINKTGDFAIDYAERCGLNGFVLGISGGLDSAVAAYTLRNAIDRRGSKLKLIGLSIPISNTNAHMQQAQQVADETCDSFMEYNEFNGQPFDDIMTSLSKTDSLIEAAGIEIVEAVRPVLAGNAKARMRMIIQYDIARKGNCIVVGTENKSEYQNSFFSLFGDAACDICFTSEMYKGLEMWQISEALGIDNEIIYQDPSDGLGVTAQNTDEAQLGYSYLESDCVMACYLGEVEDEEIMKFYNQNIVDTELYKKVIKRYIDFGYKRQGVLTYDR